MRGRIRKREPAVGVAHGVGEPRAARDDEQPVALGELAERRADSRAALRSRPRPPPTLTTVSTGAPPAAGERRGGCPPRGSVGDRRARAAPRPRGPGTPRSRPRRPGAAGGRSRARRAAASIWRTCSSCRKAAIASISAASSCSASAHTSRAIRSRANADGGRAAVGRRAVVGLRREAAEDEVHVGADREVLRRHRAPAAADRHARRDRREVGAQHAGVDELAGQQPLEVVAPARRDAPAGDRDDVGGRAADVDQQRVGVRCRPPRAPSPPSWRRRRPTAARAPPPPARARRPSVSTLSGRSPSAVLGRVEHERHPLALGPERVGQLGGHRDRHGVRRTGLGGDLAQHRGERLAVAPDLERARDRPQRRARRSQAALVFAPPMSIASVAGVRVVGVIDLKDGTAVHAVRGERERYRPVQRASREAATRSRSRARSGPSSGSTSSTSPTSTRSPAPAPTTPRSRALAREARVMVDAGVERAGAGARSCSSSARSASSSGPRRWPAPTRSTGCSRRSRSSVLSVDLRDGRMLSPDPQLAGPAGARGGGAAAPPGHCAR